MKEGPEGVKWKLGFAYFSTGKRDWRHWGWDLATGTGKNVAYNGDGKSVLLNLQTIGNYC